MTQDFNVAFRAVIVACSERKNSIDVVEGDSPNGD